MLKRRNSSNFNSPEKCIQVPNFLKTRINLSKFERPKKEEIGSYLAGEMSKGIENGLVRVDEEE